MAYLYEILNKEHEEWKETRREKEGQASLFPPQGTNNKLEKLSYKKALIRNRMNWGFA
jgi:hypothetical protein